MAFLRPSDDSIGVHISTTADTKGADQTRRSLQQLDDSGNESSKVMSALGAAAKLTAVAVTAVGVAGIAVGKNFVASAADFEQTRIGLENMLGSADAARTMLSNISDFAAETPFEFPELAGATRQLVAFGFSGDEAFKTMKQLGDVSAAIGAPIGDLAYLMGTLKAQGRAFTVDIRQFAQRGIPIYEYLAKVFKVNTTELDALIEAGKVGFPEVQKAFEMMTAEGGKFHGTMEKQSQSLSGLWSTLKDNIGMAGRELVGITQTGDIKEGSLFAQLQTGLTWLNGNLPMIVDTSKKKMGELALWFGETGSKVGDYLLPKVVALGDTIAKSLGPAVLELVRAIGPEAGAGLVWAIGMGIDALNGFLTVASPVISFLADNTWIIWGVTGAFVALRAALAISAAVTAFQAGMAVITATSIATSGTLTATTGVIGGMRLALAGLLGPWQITLAILGVAAVVAGIKEVADWLDKLLNKWDKAKGQQIPLGTTGSKIDAGSDMGLTQRFLNSLMHRASGGPVSPGQMYAVGDNPDGSFNDTTELFIPKTSGQIVNARDTKRMMSGGGGGNKTISVTQNIYSQVDFDKGIRELGFRLSRA